MGARPQDPGSPWWNQAARSLKTAYLSTSLGGASETESSPSTQQFQQPLGRDIRIIIEGHLRRPQFHLAAKGRELRLEASVLAAYLAAARQKITGAITQPISRNRNGLRLSRTVRSNILAGNIGNEFLIPKRVAVENEAPLALLKPIAKPLGTQEHPELQRHVETRQSCCSVQLRARQIMNAESTLFDSCEDFELRRFCLSELGCHLRFRAHNARGIRNKLLRTRHNRKEAYRPDQKDN
jgi:hypothetical protein